MKSPRDLLLENEVLERKVADLTYRLRLSRNRYANLDWEYEALIKLV